MTTKKIKQVKLMRDNVMSQTEIAEILGLGDGKSGVAEAASVRGCGHGAGVVAESGAVVSGGGRGDKGTAEALTVVAGETAVAFEAGSNHRGLVRDASGPRVAITSNSSR